MSVCGSRPGPERFGSIHRISPDQAPPPAVITVLTAGTHTYRDPVSLKLPAGASNIQIDFAVPTLKAPETTRVRYRLEGVDRQWIDPGRRREAFYTNLPPGHYRFRVIDANKDGPWNGTEAALNLDLPPTFFQSRIFATMAAAIIVAALWLLHRLHLRNISRRMRARLNDRLPEREQIARDLHDPLLQGCQALVWRFQRVADDLESASPLRSKMEEALDRADQVIAEARDKVGQLRTATSIGTLTERLGVVGARLQLDYTASFALHVEGLPTPLDRVIANELAQIGSEAIFNAFLHASANQIDATLRFDLKAFKLIVRDDGVGFSSEPEGFRQRPGHFGLQGMHERAQRCGGVLLLSRREPSGTIVTVEIPAKRAYNHTSTDQDAGWSIRRGLSWRGHQAHKAI